MKLTFALMSSLSELVNVRPLVRGETMRGLRLQAGLTQRQVANELGLSSSHYAKLERVGPVKQQTYIAALSVFAFSREEPVERQGK